MAGPPHAKILVVDDESGVRQIIQLRLEFNGYEVLTAANGEEAFRLACTAQPALILLDALTTAATVGGRRPQPRDAT